MKIKRPGLLVATLIPTVFTIWSICININAIIDVLAIDNTMFVMGYFFGFLIPYLISYAIWGICVLIYKIVVKPVRRGKAGTKSPQSAIKKLPYVVVERNEKVSSPKAVYIKVATRADIPEGVEYDDQSGNKIVYVVMDED